jgi:hypothetical protein
MQQSKLVALAAVIAVFGLAACEKTVVQPPSTTVVTAPKSPDVVPVPVPGPPGAPGAPGPQGEPGKSKTDVVVVPVTPSEPAKN